MDASISWCRSGIATRLLLGSIVLAAASLAAAPSAAAADYYWVGARHGSDRFEDPANWSTISRGPSCQCRPLESDGVVFNHSGGTVRLRSIALIERFTMTNTWSGTIMIGTGSLVVGGLSSDGELRIGSGTMIGGVGVVPGLRLPNIMVFGEYAQTGGTVRNLTLSGDALAFGVIGNFSLRDGGATPPSFIATGAVLLGSNDDGDFVVDSSPAVRFSLASARMYSPSGDGIVRFSGAALSLASDLVFSGAGIFDLTSSRAPLSIGGDLVMTSDGSHLVDLRLGGAMTLSGNLTLSPTGLARLTPNGHGVRLNGGAQTLSGALAFSGLTIASSTATLLSRDISISVGSTLTIATGSTLTLRGFVVRATGATIMNFGTLHEGTGAVVHAPSAFAITNAAHEAVSELTIVGGAGQVFVTLVDGDENITSDGLDAASIVVSLNNGDVESVLLTETAPASGVFRGAIPIALGVPVMGDGALHGEGVATLRATFLDEEDGLVSDTVAVVTLAGVSSGGGNRGTSGGGAGVRSVSISRHQGRNLASSPAALSSRPSALVTSRRLSAQLSMCRRLLRRAAVSPPARRLTSAARRRVEQCASDSLSHAAPRIRVYD